MTRTVTLRWKAVGGPGVTIFFLVALSPFALVSAFMSFMALTSRGTTSGPLIAFVLAMTIGIWLLVLLVLDAQFYWHQTLTITPDDVVGRLDGGVFGGSVGSLRRWREPVRSLRTVRVKDEDTLEFAGKGLTRRMLVHLPAPGEPEWIAGAARAIIGL